MTLILTELSAFGIAMAADSAVTFTLKSGNIYAKPNKAKKLHVIPYLNAGISCWGLGKINNLSTDKWLESFINSNNSIHSLGNFANELARQLNIQVNQKNRGSNTLGFHLAAFEDYNGTPTPSFFHIHNVTNTSDNNVNPNTFSANHDVTPERFHELAQKDGYYITRNGDFQLYANIFGLLENFFKELRPIGIIIPNSQDLSERAEYLVFQIRTMIEIYRLSNLVPGIGGGINYLTINPDGIHSQGVKYF